MPKQNITQTNIDHAIGMGWEYLGEGMFYRKLPDQQEMMGYWDNESGMWMKENV